MTCYNLDDIIEHKQNMSVKRTSLPKHRKPKPGPKPKPPPTRKLEPESQEIMTESKSDAGLDPDFEPNQSRRRSSRKTTKASSKAAGKTAFVPRVMVGGDKAGIKPIDKKTAFKRKSKSPVKSKTLNVSQRNRIKIVF